MRIPCSTGWVLFLLPMAALGNTNYVSTNGTSVAPYSSWATAATNIQDAVNAASPGDTVQVGEGTYLLTEPIVVTNAVGVISENGAGLTVIDGQGTCGCVVVGDTASISGFTLRNGNAVNGAGVRLDHGGIVSHSIITSNQSVNAGGGAFFNEGGLMMNCLVIDNTSANAGGGLGFYLGGTLENCTVANNTATGNGGGIYSYVGSAVVNSIIWSNTAATAGDNWFHDAGAMPFSFSCTTPDPGGNSNLTNAAPQFMDATASNYRLIPGSPCINGGTNLAWTTGADDLDGNPRVMDGTCDIGAFEFDGNWIHAGASPTHYVSTSGTAIWPYTNWVTAATHIQNAVDTAQAGNSVLLGDGTYYPGAPITISNAITVESAMGASATLIHGQNTHRCFYLADVICTLRELTISTGRHDSTNLYGGGVYCAGTNPVIENCTISENKAIYGGGIYQGRAYGCLIRNNVGYDSGGGLYGSIANSCTIQGNEARMEDGAGAYLSDVRNCLIIGNTSDGDGGGLHSCIAVNCTISENDASHNGGGVNGGSVSNCIVWSNTTYFSIGGKNITNATVSYTCSPDASHGINGSITNDPQFVNNTLGYRLLSSSPCIDAGYDAGETADLDGIPRPLDGDADGSAAPDMGCYELLYPWADSDGDGLCDRDELDTYGSDPTLADTDDDGRTDGTEVAMGYSPTYNETPAIAVGVATVTNAPGDFGLYTEETISDLDMGYLMIQADAGTVRLDCQIQQCTNLTEDVWSPAGSALQWDMPATAGKLFYRVHSGD